MLRNHINDLIHAILVAFIVISATVYAAITKDHTDNIWIVYGSAVAFAAGRAGVSAVRQMTLREHDAAQIEEGDYKLK